jgi:four helix bundle protein
VATFHRFEELEVWKKSRELTKLIYDCTKRSGFTKDRSLKDQIRRAVVSTMSNIAEGSERGGNPEFIHFLTVAKGSAAEVRSQLYVAFDQTYLTEDSFDALTRRPDEISRMILGLINYLRRSGMRGSKFKKND